MSMREERFRHAPRAIRTAMAASVLLWTSFPVLADEAADRQTLLGMLGSIEAAINARDMSSVMPYLLPTSIVTFQDGTVLTGADDAQAFFDRMMTGASSVLTDIDAQAAISAPATFLTPDIAIAHGTLDDRFTFRGGSELNLRTVWTTTVLREADRWYVGSLHLSSDVFDNPILNAAKRTALYAALAGLACGVALTGLFVWLGRRRRLKIAVK